MRIQHNIQSLNAQRNLTKNNNALNKNIEKLSSGYRINRAGDDAAGLAISEKMRGQIRGLNQAVNNANDGISLIKTAEGALDQTHQILQRMRELSVQSANGTYQNEVDRENINKEVEALKSEIDRISSSTHFNKINLLDGTMGGTEVDLSADTNLKDALSVSISGGNLAGTGLAFSAEAFEITSATTGEATINAAKVTMTLGGAANTAIKGSFEKVSSSDGVTTYAYKAAATSTKEEVDALSGATVTMIASKDATGNYTAAKSGALATTTVKANNSLVFQIGANGTADQQVSLAVKDMSSKGIGIADISCGTRTEANDAIATIDRAINTVSSTRADLGALQNRLEYTVDNLSTTSENLQAAESRIRDADMAKEMSEMTKNNILAQAAQSMLAQANAQPQGVLSLLQ